MGAEASCPYGRRVRRAAMLVGLYCHRHHQHGLRSLLAAANLEAWPSPSTSRCAPHWAGL